jgi:ArsR family transcriptional regulator, arsenate/arsenite/antimonite-responsive transcriptional repressor
VHACACMYAVIRVYAHRKEGPSMRDLAMVFQALSDETRLQMLALLLREKELCVCDVMEVLQISQSKASRHLRFLFLAGLVQDRREAVWVHYRISDALDAARARIVEALRESLPGVVPAELFRDLKEWKKRKAQGCATCRAEKRPRVATGGGR